jgi:chemotaxis protein MotB
MSKKQKKPEDAAPGAPDWMVTFSDCMTLLLTFFVLLLSFAGFGEETFNGIGQSFADALPSIGRNTKTESASMYQNNQSKHRDKITKGTETRTLTEDDTDNFMKEKKPLDFKNLRVFSVSSS